MFDAVSFRYAARCYAMAAAFRSAEARRAHMRYASRRYAAPLRCFYAEASRLFYAAPL
jgi:hypothetical protein